VTVKVYLRELAAVCKEASESSDPRVIALAVALVFRAPFTLWRMIHRCPAKKLAAC